MQSDTPRSVRIFRTTDRTVAEASTGQHRYSREIDINDPGGIRTPIPASDRLQTHALDGAAKEIDSVSN